MATLTVTSRGQVTLRKEVLQHLGVKPGDKIDVDLLPGNKVQVQAERPRKSWDEVFGMLKGKTTKKATLEEIEETIRKGWAGELEFED